jgi:HlyD family secretion protein
MTGSASTYHSFVPALPERRPSPRLSALRLPPEHFCHPGAGRRPVRDPWGRRLCLTAAVILLGLVAGCRRPDSGRIQGYVEGQFVYVASPLPGALEALHVQRGAQVKAGEPLFTLDSEPQQALVDEAAQRVAQAHAALEDAQKGKRPSEIESVEAQLRQAQDALTLSEIEFGRQEKLFSAGATTAENFDRARSDQVAAAEANVRALEAALAEAQWNLSQKSQAAPQAGLVFDTLYREGEWVAAGRPVVSLLPPENIKVRVFVPETRIGTVRVGAAVRVTVDGVGEPLAGRVSFISPQAEYTPPVIYSRESRAKLVFMIEVVFEPATAATLHPGQPVDVQFGP